MTAMSDGRVPVPRDPEDDYTRRGRRRPPRVPQRADGGPSFDHVADYSFDPAELSGNIEQFVGVAQVPIGVAGPLLVNGEHAQGEFYVPMATAEGTLVASYNRGMRLLHEAGGVKTTVMDDQMQRAPVFIFESAREARAFGEWLEEQLRRHQGRRRDDHALGSAARHRAVLGEPHAVHPLQLHDRRRRRAEPDRQGHAGRVQVDRRASTP